MAIVCVTSNRRERSNCIRPGSPKTTKGKMGAGIVSNVRSHFKKMKLKNLLPECEHKGKVVVKMISGKMVELIKNREVRKEN